MGILFKISTFFIFLFGSLASGQVFQVFSDGNRKFFLAHRSLQSEICSISNCVECTSDNTACKLCYTGYSLQNTNCSVPASSASPSSDQMKVVIIMAFISIPIMLIVFCCFIYLFFKKKPNSRRIIHDPTYTEVNGFPLRSDRFSQSLARIASVESYINSGSNLMITTENFNTLFPVVLFESLASQEACTICFEELREEHVIRLTPCKHVFHHECLYQWLVVNDQKRCPNDNIKLC